MVSAHANRTWKVRGIGQLRCDQEFFELNDENGTRTISVYQYFKDRYPDHCRGMRPDLPTLHVGKQSDPASIKIPMDLCKIMPGQPQQNITPDMQAEMITKTAKGPEERWNGTIEPTIQDYAQGGGVLSSFEVQVDNRPVEADARVLDPARLLYRSPNGHGISEPRMHIDKGSWDLQRGEKLQDPKDKRMIICDEVLRKMTKQKEIDAKLVSGLLKPFMEKTTMKNNAA